MGQSTSRHHDDPPPTSASESTLPRSHARRSTSSLPSTPSSSPSRRRRRLRFPSLSRGSKRRAEAGPASTEEMVASPPLAEETSVSEGAEEAQRADKRAQEEGEESVRWHLPAEEVSTPLPPPISLAVPPIEERTGMPDESQEGPSATAPSTEEATASEARSTHGGQEEQRNVPARRILVTGQVACLPRPQTPRASSSSSATTTSTEVTDPPTSGEPFTTPIDEEAGSFVLPPTEPRRPSSPVTSLFEQALLISRLLSVASAATAASLLPGRIRINGQTVAGFPEVDLQTASSTMGATGVPAPSASATSGDSASEQGVSRAGLSPLQSVLQQALAAESREAESPSAPTAEPTALPSPALSESNSESLATTAPTSPAASSPSAATFLFSANPSARSTPSSTAAAGTFEHFLYELQLDVAIAIHRVLRNEARAEMSTSEREFARLSTAVEAYSSDEDDESPFDAEVEEEVEAGGTRSPFAFFRHFVWPVHRITGAGQLEAVDEGTVAGDEGEAAVAEEAEATTTTQGQASQAARRSATSVSPVLMVGVRSIDVPPLARASHPSPPASSSLADPPIGSESGTSSPRTPISTADERDESSRSWLIWIAGGVYPENHPMLALPSLLSGFDSAASYEQLLALAELMGGAHKPPTASQADIAASDLRIIRGDQVMTLTGEGEIHTNTSERCLVCLEDYEREDQVRVLKCRHAYHAECVDRWLTSANNSCPTCRAQGAVQTTAPQETPATSADEAAAETEAAVPSIF